MKDTVGFEVYLVLKYNILIKLGMYDLAFKYCLIYKVVTIEQKMQVVGMTLDTLRLFNISILVC